jgi:hypothetical protein
MTDAVVKHVDAANGTVKTFTVHKREQLPYDVGLWR